jgi:hypothetical protein
VGLDLPHSSLAGLRVAITQRRRFILYHGG